MTETYFYLSDNKPIEKEKGRFTPLTKNWAIWQDDLKYNAVIIKHLTCQGPVSGDTLIGKANFTLKNKRISCIRCGKRVPAYIRKLLLLNKLDI